MTLGIVVLLLTCLIDVHLCSGFSNNDITSSEEIAIIVGATLGSLIVLCVLFFIVMTIVCVWCKGKTLGDEGDLVRANTIQTSRNRQTSVSQVQPVLPPSYTTLYPSHGEEHSLPGTVMPNTTPLTPPPPYAPRD